MLSSISNLSRKSNKFGELHFISFYSSVLCRLSYFDDNRFLTNYNKIFGPIITDNILTSINSVESHELEKLLDDETLFQLKIENNKTVEYNKKLYIDFVGLDMPQNINIINGETKGTVPESIPSSVDSKSVQYISLGWSNYGQVYVVADKRMPQTLFLLFRGTYSARTASLYSKPTSIVPLSACKKSENSDSFLYGIFKTNVELLHTTIEAMHYLATSFLKADKPNSIKIFTTGHSLGGAMCTNFAYLWMSIKKTAPYNTGSYNVLSDNIICISLAAPRAMSSSVASKFCKYVEEGKILYLRVTSKGDPVPGLPPKTGFQHPCSQDKQMRPKVSEACTALLTMRPTPNVNYKGDLDCVNYVDRVYVPNMLSHTIYLDILYVRALDIVNFIKGIGMSKEVLRSKTGSTVCRVVLGSGLNDYRAAFFDVNKAREIANDNDQKEEEILEKISTIPIEQSEVEVEIEPPPPVLAAANKKTSSPFSFFQGGSSFKIGGSIPEDIRMTKEAFQKLVDGMERLEIGKLTPQSPPSGKFMDDIFKNNDKMPELSCSSQQGGGGREGGKYKKRTRKRTVANKKKKKKSRKTKKKNVR